MVKILVSLPGSLIDEIDEIVDASDVSRSELMKELLEFALENVEFEEESEEEEW